MLKLTRGIEIGGERVGIHHRQASPAFQQGLGRETRCCQRLLMMHAGTMSNEVVMRSQKLFATEVLPAIRDLDKTPRRAA